MLLLDTNVVSELRKMRSGRADARVAGWATRTALSDTFLSVITLREVHTGLLLMERKDPRQAECLRRWVETWLRPEFERRTLPVDVAVALRCAALHVPDPRPALDALIAATALVHGLTVVTRNVADFRPMGVPILNPWEAGPAARP